ncbi:MAG: MFS transporter [Isosphaeraceae bacterium]
MTTRLPRTLLLLTLAHLLVDTFAGMIQPLWPDLQRSLRLDDAGVQTMFLLWTLSTSLSQLAFGYCGDRLGGRWLLLGGTTVGVLGMSAVGLAGSPASLGLLLLFGGLGIAAFHPEAAAGAGACAPRDRARAMSLFAVGGFLGQAAGPVYSGVVSTRYGMPALIRRRGLGLGAARVARRLPPEPRDLRRRGRRPLPCPGGFAPGSAGGERAGVSFMLVGALRVLPGRGCRWRWPT